MENKDVKIKVIETKRFPDLEADQIGVHFGSATYWMCEFF
jgi:hypothetical protein